MSDVVELGPVDAAPVAELPPVPEPAKPEQDKFAPKFAALTRKEKTLREQEKQIAAKEKELQTKLSEYEAKLKEQQNWPEKFKQKPLEVMKELGLEYDQLTEMVLNEGNPTLEMKMQRMQEEMDKKYQSRIDQLEQNLKEKEEREANEQYQQTEAAYKKNIQQLIESNADKYELIAANNATNDVFDLIKEYYNESGKILTPEEAANEVEAFYEEQAKKIFELKKIKGKFAQPHQDAKPGQAKETPTLSNNLSAERPASGDRFLSDEESKREAAKLIRWQD